jgi:hypothetical protein
MTEIFDLGSKYKGRLNPYALKRVGDWLQRILTEVPQIRQLTAEELNADLDTYLNDDERAEFSKCEDDVVGWLHKCLDTGDRFCSHAYDEQAIHPMSRIESLIKETYRRVEAARLKKEYDGRWRAAFISIKPPVDDAKKYLNDKEHDEFAVAIGKAIKAYLEVGTAYLSDLRASDYRRWLDRIQERKRKEAQKQQATIRANEYSHRLDQEIAELTARLDHKHRDVGSYFRSKIRDRRYTGHDFDFALSKKHETDFDGILVSVANKRLEELCPRDLRQFIVLPSRYYRWYCPLPSASYGLKEVPSLDFSFAVFAVAYAEVWLRPANTSVDGYEFLLPWVRDDNGVPLLKKPKFLGYYYLILRPEDFGGYVFWKSIPLLLLRGLLNGEAKPGGSTILAATDSAITYRVECLQEGVEVPDKFAGYLKSVGSMDEMVRTGIMTEKVGNIVKAALTELEAKRKKSPAAETTGRRNSTKGRAFQLFGEGKRPSDPEVKALGLKPDTAYRYYQEWKKLAAIANLNMVPGDKS